MICLYVMMIRLEKRTVRKENTLSKMLIDLEGKDNYRNSRGEMEVILIQINDTGAIAHPMTRESSARMFTV